MWQQCNHFLCVSSCSLTATVCSRMALYLIMWSRESTQRQRWPTAKEPGWDWTWVSAVRPWWGRWCTRATTNIKDAIWLFFFRAYWLSQTISRSTPQRELQQRGAKAKIALALQEEYGLWGPSSDWAAGSKQSLVEALLKLPTETESVCCQEFQCGLSLTATPRGRVQ